MPGTRTLFRGLQGPAATGRDFWSNKRLGRPPRHEEITDEREYDSLSMWDSREALEAVCRRLPRVGSHIGQLELPDEPGGPFEMWRSGRPGHWSVRGEPLAFLRHITRVDPVKRES
jgi:hypothetical protein